MAPFIPKLVIIAPFIAASACTWASNSSLQNSPFGFDKAELDSIQFTRSKAGDFNLDVLCNLLALQSIVRE
jgi:hypothetical protein